MRRRWVVAFLPLALVASCVLSPVAPSATPTPASTATAASTNTPSATDTPPPTSTPAPLFSIKVITYNILYGAGVDRRFDNQSSVHGPGGAWARDRLPEVLSFIEQADPDVLGIEEAAGWNEGTPTVVQKVAQELNMNYFLARPADSWDALNVVIFTKFKIVESQRFGADVGRGLRVRLVTPGGYPVNVFVVHLEANDANIRWSQMQALGTHVQSYSGEHTVVMGDFNMNHWFLPPLSDAGMKAVAWGSGAELDQIWMATSGSWSTTPWFKSLVLPETASDHLPVGVELVIYK